MKNNDLNKDFELIKSGSVASGGGFTGLNLSLYKEIFVVNIISGRYINPLVIPTILIDSDIKKIGVSEFQNSTVYCYYSISNSQVKVTNLLNGSSTNSTLYVYGKK